MKKMSLLKSFTILSLATFVITGFMLVGFIYNHMRDDKIESIDESVHLTLRYIIESKLSTDDFIGTLNQEKKDELNREFKQLIDDNSVMGIRIWNKSDNIIYSIGSEELNNYFNQHNYTISNSSEMSNYTIIKETGSLSSSSDGMNDKILKIDMPIEIDGNYIGSYEVLKSYRDIEEHLKNLSVKISIIVFTGLIILYIFLLRIIHNSSKTLVKQNKELNESKQKLQEAYDKLNDSYKDTIITVSNAIDARDQYTAGHSKRVAEISVKIGEAIGVKNEELEKLELSALFHDVGKIGIRDNILLKEGKLTNDEFSIIKQHPSLGVKLLENVEFMKHTLKIILSHHERFSGGGYPNGISGEEIPLESRIIAVADSYDAMTSDRAYRKGMAHEAAVEEIVRNKGTQFDITVVEAFLKVENCIRLSVSAI